MIKAGWLLSVSKYKWTKTSTYSEFGGITSEEEEAVTDEVSQYSVLGPLLFFIYINGMLK